MEVLLQTEFPIEPGGVADETDLATEVDRRGTGAVPAQDRKLSVIGLDECGKQAEERCLAHPVRSLDPKPIARIEGQIEVVEDACSTENDTDIPERNQGGHLASVGTAAPDTGRLEKVNNL